MATLAQPSITRPSWGSLELGDPSTSSPRSAYRHGKQYSLPPNQASPPNSNNVRPPKSRHVFGLSLLTKTPDAKKHDKAKTVDIVAIHGINGHALNTWKAEGGALWLRDFMCKDIRSARVFTFGYDAQLLFTESHASLQKFAASLLDELMVARGGVLPTRTLVFICHGMGGFIAKEALIQTRLNERLVLKDCVKAIIFLSTPQRESPAMPWPSLLVNVAETSLSLRSGLDEESHRDLLASLKRDSQALYSVSLNFMKHAAGIKIISCYEQMPTPPQSECCINEHTGGLGLPGEKLIPMAGCDHRSVACFSSRDDEKYRLVVHEIKKVVRASAKSMSASPSLPANRRVQGEHAPWNDGPDPRRFSERQLQRSLDNSTEESRSSASVQEPRPSVVSRRAIPAGANAPGRSLDPVSRSSSRRPTGLKPSVSGNSTSSPLNGASAQVPQCLVPGRSGIPRRPVPQTSISGPNKPAFSAYRPSVTTGGGVQSSTTPSSTFDQSQKVPGNASRPASYTPGPSATSPPAYHPTTTIGSQVAPKPAQGWNDAYTAMLPNRPPKATTTLVPSPTMNGPTPTSNHRIPSPTTGPSQRTAMNGPAPSMEVKKQAFAGPVSGKMGSTMPRRPAPEFTGMTGPAEQQLAPRSTRPANMQQKQQPPPSTWPSNTQSEKMPRQRMLPPTSRSTAHTALQSPFMGPHTTNKLAANRNKGLPVGQQSSSLKPGFFGKLFGSSNSSKSQPQPSRNGPHGGSYGSGPIHQYQSHWPPHGQGSRDRGISHSVHHPSQYVPHGGSHGTAHYKPWSTRGHQGQGTADNGSPGTHGYNGHESAHPGSSAGKLAGAAASGVAVGGMASVWIANNVNNDLQYNPMNGAQSPVGSDTSQDVTSGSGGSEGGNKDPQYNSMNGVQSPVGSDISQDVTSGSGGSKGGNNEEETDTEWTDKEETDEEEIDDANADYWHGSPDLEHQDDRTRTSDGHNDLCGDQQEYDDQVQHVDSEDEGGSNESSESEDSPEDDGDDEDAEACDDQPGGYGQDYTDIGYPSYPGHPDLSSDQEQYESEENGDNDEDDGTDGDDNDSSGDSSSEEGDGVIEDGAGENDASGGYHESHPGYDTGVYDENQGEESDSDDGDEQDQDDSGAAGHDNGYDIESQPSCSDNEEDQEETYDYEDEEEY